MGEIFSTEVNHKTFFKFGDDIGITLDISNFYEGELVSGNINLKIDKPCPPVRIEVFIKGFERVTWQASQRLGCAQNFEFEEGMTHLSDGGLITFKDKHRYRTGRITVLKTSEELAPGEHCIPFT